jgi:hypothetical protein
MAKSVRAGGVGEMRELKNVEIYSKAGSYIS